MWNYVLLTGILLAVMFISVKARKLTMPAALTGGLLGLLIYAGAGFTGIAMIAAFFITGTAATSWKLNVKQQLGLAEENKGRRTAGQVLANAGLAAVLGLTAWCFPERINLCRFMMAAGFASATAVTLSSEMGNLYGRKYYNILTFKKDSRGMDGVISLEGTLTGIAGSISIGLIYFVGFEPNVPASSILWIVIAGTFGNLADSVLGATLERRNMLNNDAVNFLNTLVAALLAMSSQL